MLISIFIERGENQSMLENCLLHTEYFFGGSFPLLGHIFSYRLRGLVKNVSNLRGVKFFASASKFPKHIFGCRICLYKSKIYKMMVFKERE